MAFRHGVYTSELPTSILPARSVDSNVVFAVGTAAVDRLDVLFRPGARLLDVVEHRGRVSVRGAPSALHTLSELAFLDMAVLLLPLCRGAQLDAVNLNHGGSPP